MMKTSRPCCVVHSLVNKLHLKFLLLEHRNAIIKGMTTIYDCFSPFLSKLSPAGVKTYHKPTTTSQPTTQNLNFYSKGAKTMLENYTNTGFDKITTVSNKSNGDF